MARKPNLQARPKQPPVPLRERLRRLLPPVLQGLGIAALMGAVVYAVIWLRDPVNLPVRAVQIEGEFRKLSAEQLQQAVAGTVQGGFFSVDVAAVRRAAEALPWVESASVRRVWPDSLRLIVVEQRAAARWGDSGLLNMRGELFEPPADSIPQHLPRLAGPEPLRRRVLEHYIAMTESLAPIGRRVQSLQLDARRAWELQLDNGVALRLGRDHALPRLERFVRVYPQVFAADATRLSAVDLRYSNGFAVRWERSPETAGQPQEG